MPSPTSRLVVGYLRLTRANRVFASPDAARQHVRRTAVRPRPYGPPRRLRRDVSVVVAQRHGLPVYTVTPHAGRPRGSVVYVHGGAWVNEIAPQHWHLVARIAAEARTTVTVPVYPLVPFGTAEDVVPAVVDLVLAGTARHGTTCLAGDSAGAQIALSAAVALRDEHAVTVPRTVLISPALDLTLSNPRMDDVQPRDPWLAREGTRVLIDHWRGRLDVTDPRVSPLAADLSGLGPLTVLSGTRDILDPDARLLVERAAAAGVDAELCTGAGLVHVYPLTPTPEGRAARVLIVDRLRTALAAA